MANLTLRTVKGSPLTNSEVDANFTSLNNSKLEASNNLSDISSAASARSNLELEIGIDVQAHDSNLDLIDQDLSIGADVAFGQLSAQSSEGLGKVIAAFQANLPVTSGRGISIIGPEVDNDSSPFIISTENSIVFRADITDGFGLSTDGNLNVFTSIRSNSIVPLPGGSGYIQVTDPRSNRYWIGDTGDYIEGNIWRVENSNWTLGTTHNLIQSTFTSTLGDHTIVRGIGNNTVDTAVMIAGSGIFFGQHHNFNGGNASVTEPMSSSNWAKLSSTGLSVNGDVSITANLVSRGAIFADSDDYDDHFRVRRLSEDWSITASTDGSLDIRRIAGTSIARVDIHADMGVIGNFGTPEFENLKTPLLTGSSNPTENTHSYALAAGAIMSTPASPSDGDSIIVYGEGDMSGNPGTINTPGLETIEGSATFGVNRSYTFRLVYRSLETDWKIYV